MKKKYPVALLALLALFAVGCKKENKAKVVSSNNSNGTFNIPTDSVRLNPTGNAPLSALVHFKTQNAGHTQIRVKGMHGAASDVVQEFTDAGTDHIIPIVGLYGGYTNTVTVNVIDSKNDTLSATLKITTAAFSSPNLPNYIHTDVADLANMENGFNLVSSFSGYPSPPQIPYMVDSFGDIRWYLDFTNNPTLKNLFYDCGINRLQDGNYRFVDQSTETIYEVDIMGKIVNTWSMSGYIFHHDLYEMPNGNFLVTCTDPNSTHTNGSQTIEDNIIEIDRKSGNILNHWDLKESLNEYRQTLSTDPVDWIHENGLVYDASDNTIIVSGRVQGVFKLTFDNHVKWILGPHKDWGKNRRGEDLNQFLLTPLDANGNAITDPNVLDGSANAADFEWNFYQHSPQLLPNGDLTLFDNGQTRNYNDNQQHYSRAVEFKIDATNMTVQQIWEYGKERGSETFSPIVSSVNYLPTKKHILFSPGYSVPNATGNGGKIVEVDYATKQVVFQMSISSANSWGFHRVQRMTIYPNGNPYQP
jgi:arylsulfate sulfotransferase